MAPAGGLGPAHISYSQEDYGDWSHVPPEVAAAIAHHLVGDRLVAWVNQKKTRRRGVEFYQSLSAWWASTTVVVEIKATRPLVQAEAKRFSPAGPWSGQATAHRLFPAQVAAKSFTRRGSEARDTSVPAPPERLVHDSLEVLPEPLRRVTAGGPPAGSVLWDHGHGQVVEEVMAYRVLNTKAVVLSAWRGPVARDGLNSATWHSRLLDTSVVETGTYPFGNTATWSSASAPRPNPPTLDAAKRRGLRS